MILLDKYGSTLTAVNKFATDKVEHSSAQPQVVVSTAGQVMTGILALIISLAAGFIGMVMYKRRQYNVPGPSTLGSRKKYGPPDNNVYRKRIAYTELKDMNND
ncbi:hypothetical protein HZH68_011156 [Vespula germanica]|uniref:Uncharacterized protein n=4 Tax=Vespula TaxID=7451 RepID=A0A834JN21_VESGE|nr:hypothetical protein HZH68_011156 [Vespula germanica]